MKTKTICMYCGKNPRMGNHQKCHARLEIMAQDLRSLPKKDQWKVYAAAERGYYGTVKSKAPKATLLPKREKRKPEMKPKIRVPEFQERLIELYREGKTYDEMVSILRNEGFKSAQGKRLTIDHLRCRIYRIRKSAS